MNAQQLLKADLLDILFEGKNKSYGAYPLRKGYYKRLYLALGISLLLTVIISALLIFWPKSNVKNSAVIVNDLELKDKPKPEKPKEEIKPITPKKQAPVKTIVYTIPKIVQDDIVIKPPTQSDVKAAIGHVDVPIGDDGDKLLPVIIPNNGGGGTNIAPEIIKPDPVVPLETKDLTSNTQKPITWNKYLQTALQPYVNKATEEGCEHGIYRITVRFLVDEVGNPLDATIVSGQNPCNIGHAAIAILLKGPKWTINRTADGTATKSIQQTTFVIQIAED